SRRRHTRFDCDWSSDVCSSDLLVVAHQPQHASGRNPKHAAVAATEGVLRLMSDHELEGVIAHELAHVKHRDILISSVAATVAAEIGRASCRERVESSEVGVELT